MPSKVGDSRPMNYCKSGGAARNASLIIGLQTCLSARRGPQNFMPRQIGQRQANVFNPGRLSGRRIGIRALRRQRANRAISRVSLPQPGGAAPGVDAHQIVYAAAPTNAAIKANSFGFSGAG
ncbi:MAG TPA: hypothetical protein VFW22_11140 [Pseudolabrys sp.]|nr:hypothetical protein [Pseudolabrys sp.]